MDGNDADNDDDEEALGCLFVKNLSFSTTDATLKAAFSACQGFRSALVMKKKGAIKNGKATELSMGYGFLEFATAADATEALKRKQGIMLEGHSIKLQVSTPRSKRNSKEENKEPKKGGKGALNTQRLCVRNLAFEANVKELRQLFSAYGSVTSVRMPKKADHTGHRGFAFIDLGSKAEAAAAFEALQHTHLYGRRLVIEPAEEKANDVGSAQEAAQKRSAAHTLTSESKKRRRAGVLNATGEGGAFSAGMDVEE